MLKQRDTVAIAHTSEPFQRLTPRSTGKVFRVWMSQHDRTVPDVDRAATFERENRARRRYMVRIQIKHGYGPIGKDFHHELSIESIRELIYKVSACTKAQDS